MRKKFIAAIVAALMLVACVPFISGCSASVNYVLSEDKTHYIASCTGSKSSLTGELVIKEEYNDLSVTEIAQEGFRGTSITKVVIPAKIASIGMAAFANCNLLTTVEFASGSQLEEIPQGAFGYCGNLTNITLPQTIISIGHLAFIGCERLKKIEIPQNVKVIGIQAFDSCTSLSEINFPYGLETIARYAFYGTALTEIEIPSTVADKQVEDVDAEGKPVTRTVNGIGVGAFHTCEYLKKVVIKERDGSEESENVLETLTSGVFGYCTQLKDIYLPSTIKKIEEHILNDNGKFVIGHAFHHCPKMTVHFAGTQEQWKAIKIENTEYKEQGATFNNDAIKNATIIYTKQA